jgi:3-deoxy-manno-octulosonate cytidylyltransferase (CMP-KDO synthetase)
MKPIIIIPARMAATRLPGKPLADIGGKPMIVRMIELGRAAAQGRNWPVLVAAGEPEIVAAVERAGATAVLTDPDLPSGTDRIYAALHQVDPSGHHDVIINLQGDTPTMDPGGVSLALNALEQNPTADIATLLSPSDDPDERANPNVVKAIPAIRGAHANCLYFTRAAAPSGDGPIWRHVGLYVYRRAALEAFVSAPPSPLELREKLEQLRALEMGMTIVAGLVDEFPKGVDTPADLDAARAWFAEREA